MGSALESCKGKRLLAEMGGRVFQMVSSIQGPTLQLKFMFTQIPSSGFFTKRAIKNIITGFYRTRWGNFRKKRKQKRIENWDIHQCLLYGYRCSGRHAPDSLAQKAFFVFCTHSGLGSTLPVGLLPFVASLG